MGHIHSLIATQSKLHLRTFVILSGAGICSLYPLLFQAAGNVLSNHDRARQTIMRAT